MKDLKIKVSEERAPQSVRSGKASAKKLVRMQNTCVICDAVEDHMQRYFKTVAELYSAEEDFRELLSLTKGFCLKDYAGLVLNAEYAKGKAKEYLKVLAKLERENFERVQKDLHRHMGI